MEDEALHEVLSGDDLLNVLANPLEYSFRESVWYAVNASPAFLDEWPAHTLAGRLGISQAELAHALDSLGLGSKSKQTKWTADLREVAGGPATLLTAPIGVKNMRFLAFGAQPPHQPKDQAKRGSTATQPLPLRDSTRCGHQSVSPG